MEYFIKQRKQSMLHNEDNFNCLSRVHVCHMIYYKKTKFCNKQDMTMTMTMTMK